MNRRAVAVAIVLGAIGLTVLAAVLRSGADEGARCGPRFEAKGTRCLPPPGWAPDVELRVVVPAARVSVGSSDWEAEGRVPSRTIDVQAFRMDAFEVTQGRWDRWDEAAPTPVPAPTLASNLLPTTGMTLPRARAFCQALHGDLPTEEQWIAAAVSATNPPRRYPWGDTGAVCRRASWGLATGPCARGAEGPDTVGAHPDGDSALGLHDLAGNVAEWVLAAEATGRAAVAVAKGGSWASSEAADLRVWARVELPKDASDRRVGLRCAYPL